jgi:hypothetical protein
VLTCVIFSDTAGATGHLTAKWLPSSQCPTRAGTLQACGSDHSNGTICILDGVGQGQSIRRCYRERTNDVRYGVITVQYFSLRLHFTFCYFPDWLQIGLWIPNQLSPWLGLLPPAPQMDRCISLPCRGPVTRCASLFGGQSFARAAHKISEQVQHI